MLAFSTYGRWGAATSEISFGLGVDSECSLLHASSCSLNVSCGSRTALPSICDHVGSPTESGRVTSVARLVQSWCKPFRQHKAERRQPVGSAAFWMVAGVGFEPRAVACLGEGHQPLPGAVRLQVYEPEHRDVARNLARGLLPFRGPPIGEDVRWRQHCLALHRSVPQ